MSRFSGPQGKGALRAHRATVRAEAEQLVADKQAHAEMFAQAVREEAATNNLNRLRRLHSEGEVPWDTAVDSIAKQLGVSRRTAKRLLDQEAGA
ncbi:hypothetical protein [Kutzneria albida]|uniref:Uncharacterized protein n=1 Tax=Kutzneria albida DSM 43870 TaxID=1449976 RepID=W5WJA2_9PSEU|nr:hypothetical protein [Kutzneria albida]AHH98239.1 hypothetical protein KALB_4877 [Kutzneria albida DSM 43870]